MAPVSRIETRTSLSSVGIMQPYFFPYLGYFQLMHAVDRWVVFDTPQYIRHGWVNRNRVLTRGKGDWKYIRIPIQKSPRETPISEISVSDADWRAELINNLDYYRESRAPYYDETMEFILAATDCDSPLLGDVLYYTLQSCIGYLDISLESVDRFSEMKQSIEPVHHAGQWALRISEAIGAGTYINPEGGREIFEPIEFDGAKISLQFLRSDLSAYNQNRLEFLPGLSIIDCLMWIGRNETRNRVKNYEIVDASHALQRS